MENIKNIQLPVLRPDLEFVKAPDHKGCPVTTIYDPVAGNYEQADWRQMEIIHRIPLFSNLCELAADIQQNTTLRFSLEEIAAFIQGLIHKGLTRSTSTKPLEQLRSEKAQREVGLFKKMIHSYLYFRIPLIRPDRFLENTMPFVRIFASRIAFVIYAIAACFGCYGLLIRFDEYVNTFPRFFSFDGIFIYSMVIVALKLVHEFAHSYTAKHYGVRVPTMGAAFIVMWPVAFSDVTDAWRLSSRSQRFMISAAGVISELCVGAVALWLWQLSTPGIWQSIFFVLSSVTIISTILMNLNPAMRFDGYYMLIDMLEIDNLQSRAFEYTKWLYRKIFLGFNIPCPETKCSTVKLKIMVGYSVMVWIYRIFLYVGIAVMVYYKFTKVLGIFLFAVEIYMFIIMPIIKEVNVLKTHTQQFKQSRRWLLTVAVILAITAYFAVPSESTISIPAVAEAVERQVVYAPFSGQITSIGLNAGSTVKSGEKLIEINPAELEYEYMEIAAACQKAKHTLAALVADSTKREKLRQLSAEFKTLTARKEQLEQLLNNTSVSATVDGTVVFVEDGMNVGTMVKKRMLIAEINGAKKHVVAFLPQHDSAELANGQQVVFKSDAFDCECRGTVTMISPISEEFLEFTQLGSVYGGPIAVTNSQNGFKLVDSYYKIQISLEESEHIRPGQIGDIEFKSQPQSSILNGIRTTYLTLIRELNM